MLPSFTFTLFSSLSSSTLRGYTSLIRLSSLCLHRDRRSGPGWEAGTGLGKQVSLPLPATGRGYSSDGYCHRTGTGSPPGPCGAT
ncbi:hypothetical protein BJY04DRAFT_194635 [Aspergillus karnatakaensis]|uniref:uncharacterized protein n=1 Tax=Aspergillus karnatakaensis TaxID=1810916 RepID=UPI003CCCC970